MKSRDTLFPNKLFLLSFAAFVLLATVPSRLSAQHNRAEESREKTLVVGVAGSPPFVVDTINKEGISLEIWQALASAEKWNYRMVGFEDVPQALHALEAGNLDVVVGPISITSDRARMVKFTQPYFQSSLSILSRTDEPNIWERIAPFFTMKFFYAVLVFICILGIVGTLLWLAERKRNTEQFPYSPAKGIANGMWCAIVTMSTTGYGDKAPLTFWGRVLAGSWMVISIIFATTMVAGIASTLTLTGMGHSVIKAADELSGKKIAVVGGSPAADFVREYGGKLVEVNSLSDGYKLLKDRQADAMVYDRPQLLYFLKQNHDDNMSVSTAQYDQQGYGFALPMDTKILHQMNVSLLELEESGQVDRIAEAWLGEKK